MRKLHPKESKEYDQVQEGNLEFELKKSSFGGYLLSRKAG